MLRAILKSMQSEVAERLQHADTALGFLTTLDPAQMFMQQQAPWALAADPYWTGDHSFLYSPSFPQNDTCRCPGRTRQSLLDCRKCPCHPCKKQGDPALSFRLSQRVSAGLGGVAAAKAHAQGPCSPVKLVGCLKGAATQPPKNIKSRSMALYMTRKGPSGRGQCSVGPATGEQPASRLVNGMTLSVF